MSNEQVPVELTVASPPELPEEPSDFVAAWLKQREPELCRRRGARDELRDIFSAFKEMFGPPPLLSTESAVAYDFMLLDLLKRYLPARSNVVAFSLIAQLLDAIWEIKRCTRHKKLIVDLEHERWLRRRAKRRAEMQKAAKEPAKSMVSWISDEYDDELDLDLENDSDVPAERALSEHDDARAMRISMMHYGQLDDVMRHCLRAYERALDMLDRRFSYT